MEIPLAFFAVLMMRKVQSEEQDSGEGLRKVLMETEKRNPAEKAMLLCGMTAAVYKQNACA
jgi:hypothetical protein